MVEGIMTLTPGETPWQYATSPGWLPGPWATVNEALADLAREGLVAAAWWLRKGVLWIEVKEVVQ